MTPEQRKVAKRSLRRRGFDQCRKHGEYIRVGCSQCQTLVINGVACHETGCPNQPRQ